VGGSSTRAPCRIGWTKLCLAIRPSTPSFSIRGDNQRLLHQPAILSVVCRGLFRGRRYCGCLSMPNRYARTLRVSSTP
jgi:hypothetical protein